MGKFIKQSEIIVKKIMTISAILLYLILMVGCKATDYEIKNHWNDIDRVDVDMMHDILFNPYFRDANAEY